MFHSLRFRLPALFLAGIVLAGLVSAAIAVGLFQDLEEQRAREELRREATGIANLYLREGQRAEREGRDPQFEGFVTELERATGDRLFYVGVSPFVTEESPLTQAGRGRLLPDDVVAWREARITTFEFEHPPGSKKEFLGVAHQVRVDGTAFGAVVVATPKPGLWESWLPFARRLGVAFLGGILVAFGLAWYFGRRVTHPVVALSRAAEEVSRGKFEVRVEDVPGRGEIRQLADRFNDMATRLREANEVERNFVMTVSHELRTPLTAIRGHVSALREGLADDPEIRDDSLAAIAGETARLERLVGDLLDLAKLEARRFTVHHEEVDMERLVERAYAGFDQEARRRGIEYDRSVTAEPTIVSDGDRVLQIVTNLLSNAFRWTPDGGRVGVELAQQNGTVSVAVADTGPGIVAAEREHIFRPFWSGDRGGTGLGLAISRELAVALGGTIELDTEPGKGSRFELLLPSKPDDAPDLPV